MEIATAEVLREDSATQWIRRTCYGRTAQRVGPGRRIRNLRGQKIGEQYPSILVAGRAGICVVYG